ncbi:class I SAM-dependent methyltransferase [Thermoactinospora rubra]|uniref:class I SAM-dependent methyltransferase n=1 Tax=Thermoactinospora rubra TaxID=1088767 RepID=UPI000A110E28|nr:class I SAM-dependent methyltransferase [Thermoactinospora rubra]
MASTAEQFVERLLGAALGTIDVLAVHLGDRLGWYRALADHGPATPAELAGRAGGDERYAREWLEQQACAGILEVGDDGRFALPDGAAEVLTDRSSLNFLAPLARMLAGAAVQMPALVEAYRNGGGVGWDAFGEDVRESQADMNRPWFEHALPKALAGLPDIDAVLRRPGARIVDVGCGAGWSTIALARAYPEAKVEGVDIDPPSIAMAERNAEGMDVAFRAADAADLGEGGYDAAFAFECIHDMPRPVDTLAAMRRAVVPGGPVVIMDEAVADAFHPDGGDVERLMYGFSLLICLPDGRSHQPSAATGTVMRPDTLRRYAVEAGFRDIEVLPIDDFGFWRFYRLVG